MTLVQTTTTSFYLFGFSESHPQLESLDEKLHHVVVLRVHGQMKQLSLLYPLGHNKLQTPWYSEK